MAVKTDQIKVLLETQIKGLATAVDTFKTLKKQVTSTNTALKNMGFSRSLSTEIRTLEKSLKALAGGGVFERLANATAKINQNLASAAKNTALLRYQKSDLSTLSSNPDRASLQIKAAELNANLALLNLQKRGTEANQKKFVLAENILNNLRLQQVEQKKRLANEKSISALEERAGNTRMQNAIRTNREAQVLGDFGASLFKIQASLLVNYTLMNQLFNLFSFGTRFVVELDGAFGDLQAIAEVTNTEMVGLKQTIIDVSKGTRFTAVEVANAAKILAQAGFSARQIEESIGGVALLATATGTDLATSVDVASSIISVFNLRAEDMAHVANVVTGALNLTKLTMEKVALGIQYAGNIAAEAGLTFDETTAVLGAMSNAGIKSGSTLGTGLRQVLTELLAPSEKLQKKLNGVGLTIEDIDVKSKGFVGVMKTLRDAGFSTADAFESLDLRAAAAFAAIQKNPELINELRSSFLYTNAAMKANETQMGSLPAKFDRFASSLGVVINTLSGPLVNAFKTVLDGATALLNKLSEFKPTLEIIGTLFVSLVAAFAGSRLIGLVGNLFKFVTAAKTAGVVAGGAAGGVGLLSRAFVSMISPVGAMTYGIAILIGVLGTFHNAAEAASAQLDATQAAFDASAGAYDKTNESLNSITENIGRLSNRFAELKKDPAAVFTEMVALQQQFGDIGLKINNETNPAIEDLIDALQRLRGEMAQTSAEQIKSMLTERALLFQQQADKAAKNIKQNLRFGKDGYQIGYGFQGGQSQANLQSLNDSGSLAEALAVKDLSQASQAEIIEIRAQVQKAISDVTRDKGKISAELLKLTSKKDQSFSDSIMISSYRELLEAYDAAVGEMSGINKQVQGYIIDGTQAMTKDFEATSVYQEFATRIDNFKTQISDLKQQLADAPEGDRAEIEDKIKAAIAKFEEELAKFAGEEGIKALQELLKTAGLEANSAQAGNFRSNMAADLKAAANEAKVALDSSTQETLRIKEKEIAAAEEWIATVQDMFKHVADTFDNASKRLDYLMAETLDLDRGGSAGRYSDQEIKLFKDRQKQLHIAELQAQVETLPLLIHATGGLAGAQSAKLDELDNLRSPGNAAADTAYYQAQITLIQTLSQKKDLENQLINLNDELAASTGELVEAHVPLDEQLEGVIGDYIELMRIQQTWAYDIRATVFSVLDQGREAFGTFVTDAVTGAKTVGDAFKSMATSILQSMLKVVTDKLSQQFMGMLFDAGLSFFRGGSWGSASASSAANFSAGGWSSGISAGSYNDGGRVVKANSGAFIGRDNQLVLAQAGEGILRRSAMEMLGQENFDQLNAMGNRKISAGVAAIGNAKEEKDPTVLNVWVVSPDQKPPMTPRDVEVIVGQNIQRGGSIKQLMKSINTGKL